MSNQSLNPPQKQLNTKYELVTGKAVSNGELINPMLAGYAYNYEGESHYVLRLSMFPKSFYYLIKNKDSATSYTVFSRRLVDPGDPTKIWFQNPVGSGQVTEELKSHLELRFPLIGVPIFMSLFPAV